LGGTITQWVTFVDKGFLCYQAEVDRAEVGREQVPTVVPQAEKRTSQKVAGCLTTGK